MATHLRLHRDEPVEQDLDAPVTYQFPSAMAAARRTLVAGRVRVPAFPEGARPEVRPGVIARLNVPAGVRSTDDIIRDVEDTIERMQTRIDSLREDCDEAFKFPAPFDDRPRAA